MRWTLPNILTLARICLTPVIALLPFIQGYWPKVIAFLIFLAASASDVVDGYLARRRNQVSELGQLLDPIADSCCCSRRSSRFSGSPAPTILVDYASPGGAASPCGWPCCSSGASYSLPRSAFSPSGGAS